MNEIVWKGLTKNQLLKLIEKECKWFDTISRVGDPRLWNKPTSAEGKTSKALLKKGNSIRISFSGYVDIIHADGYIAGEGVLPNVSNSGGEQIIIKI
tara:strand:+ start:730 stop:1020 length:291 start_codon:yes stop_codon:yes gene_type:complete